MFVLSVVRSGALRVEGLRVPFEARDGAIRQEPFPIDGLEVREVAVGLGGTLDALLVPPLPAPVRVGGTLHVPVARRSPSPASPPILPPVA